MHFDIDGSVVDANDADACLVYKFEVANRSFGCNEEFVVNDFSLAEQKFASNDVIAGGDVHHVGGVKCSILVGFCFGKDIAPYDADLANDFGRCEGDVSDAKQNRDAEHKKHRRTCSVVRMEAVVILGSSHRVSVFVLGSRGGQAPFVIVIMMDKRESGKRMASTNLSSGLCDPYASLILRDSRQRSRSMVLIGIRRRHRRHCRDDGLQRRADPVLDPLPGVEQAWIALLDAARVHQRTVVLLARVESRRTDHLAQAAGQNAQRVVGAPCHVFGSLPDTRNSDTA